MSRSRGGRGSEVEVARPVVVALEREGWDVYQEVTYRGGLIPDIVAVKHGIVWIVEVKVVLGWEVLEQARHHLGRAHFVSVATPPRREAKETIRQCLAALGLGWLSVSEDVLEEVRPAFFRRPQGGPRPEPEHKTHAVAGSAGGRRWSPWNAHCRAVYEFVVEHPGSTLKEVAVGVHTAYLGRPDRASNLRGWLVRGILPGVKVRKEVVGGRHILRCYPADESEVRRNGSQLLWSDAVLAVNGHRWDGE